MNPPEKSNKSLCFLDCHPISVCGPHLSEETKALSPIHLCGCGRRGGKTIPHPTKWLCLWVASDTQQWGDLQNSGNRQNQTERGDLKQGLVSVLHLPAKPQRRQRTPLSCSPSYPQNTPLLRFNIYPPQKKNQAKNVYVHVLKDAGTAW